jgi:chemotaxis protein MotB
MGGFDTGQRDPVIVMSEDPVASSQAALADVQKRTNEAGEAHARAVAEYAVKEKEIVAGMTKRIETLEEVIAEAEVRHAVEEKAAKAVLAALDAEIKAAIAKKVALDAQYKSEEGELRQAKDKLSEEITRYAAAAQRANDLQVALKLEIEAVEKKDALINARIAQADARLAERSSIVEAARREIEQREADVRKQTERIETISAGQQARDEAWRAEEKRLSEWHEQLALSQIDRDKLAAERDRLNLLARDLEHKEQTLNGIDADQTVLKRVLAQREASVINREKLLKEAQRGG